MLRHVVMFRWTAVTTPADVAAIETGLATLPGAIPTLRDYRFGRDAGINAGNYDFAVVGDFDDRAGYLTYRDHPAHKALLAERIAPHIAERAAVQYEVD